MKTSLVAIGNSRGIRIPKPVLAQCGFADELDMQVSMGQIILRPARLPRSGWDAAFLSMAENKDDALPDGEFPATKFDREEWEWK